jgi:hypothetical protein
LNGGSDFGLVHQLLEVKHEEETGIEFADAGDVLALYDAAARVGFDGIGSDSEHFADRIEDEAERLLPLLVSIGREGQELDGKSGGAELGRRCLSGNPQSRLF